jgi:hypothetical protein
MLCSYHDNQGCVRNVTVNAVTASCVTSLNVYVISLTYSQIISCTIMYVIPSIVSCLLCITTDRSINVIVLILDRNDVTCLQVRPRTQNKQHTWILHAVLCRVV